MEFEELPIEDEDNEWMDRYTLRGRIAAAQYRFRRSHRKGQAIGCGSIVGFCSGAGAVLWLLNFIGGG